MNEEMQQLQRDSEEKNKENMESGGKKSPKQPRFNFTWLYVVLIAGIVFMFFTRKESNVTKNVDYTHFKEYVEKGYASDIIISKSDLTLNMYIKPENDRAVFGNKNTTTAPRAVHVEIGSITLVEEFLNAQKEAGNFTI